MPGWTAMLRILVDDQMKKEAAEALQAISLSVSDTVRLFLRRVVAGRAIHFAIRAPNAATRTAIAEADEIVKARRGRFLGTTKIGPGNAGNRRIVAIRSVEQSESRVRFLRPPMRIFRKAF
jgi:DNA-damage-inducible protein J